MYRYFVMVIIAAALSVFGIVGRVAMAQTQPSLTEEQIIYIRENCVRVQSSLYQLHASDALLRVNRGQLYELISTKLMAPLNSRIALNKMDGLQLVATKMDYDRQLDLFRADYQRYEEAMSRTLEVRCADEPSVFYSNLNETRDKRKKVHTGAVQLNTLLQSYRSNFDEFVKNTQKGIR